MPHVIEKLIMLRNGTLSKPIDIFDLFYQGNMALREGVGVYMQILLRGIFEYGFPMCK